LLIKKGHYSARDSGRGASHQIKNVKEKKKVRGETINRRKGRLCHV